MRILATANDRRGAVRRTAAAFGIFVAFLAAGAPAASAATPGTTSPTIRFRIHPKDVWTPAGVVLKPGEYVTITATGRARFGPPPIDAVVPGGIPQGRECNNARVQAHQATRGTKWPAPSLNCWSLIGQVGSAPPFEIGRRLTFGAGAGGKLRVGVNDDYLADNSRGWMVTVRRLGTSPTTTASGKSKSSSIALILIAVAGVALVALIAFAFSRSRKRSRDAGSPTPAPAPTPAPVPVAATASSARGEVAPPTVVAVTPEGEVTAGNILEVTFAGPRALRVGYDHFPEGTVVHWRITQHNTVMTGDFETPDGRSAHHEVTLPLESELDAADVADITFAWSIGGVPFNYAVRRNPEA